VSFVIEEKALGTATLAGMATSCFGVGAIIAGVTYGILDKVFKKFMLAICPAFVAIGSLLLWQSTSAGVLLASVVIAGTGMGWSQPLFGDKVTKIGPPENGTFAGGLSQGVTGIGLFVAAFMEVFYALFVEPTAVNLVFCTMIAFGVMTVIGFIYAATDPLKGVNWSEQQEQMNKEAAKG
jgi:MFS family permease